MTRRDALRRLAAAEDRVSQVTEPADGLTVGDLLSEKGLAVLAELVWIDANVLSGESTRGAFLAELLYAALPMPHPPGHPTPALLGSLDRWREEAGRPGDPTVEQMRGDRAC